MGADSKSGLSFPDYKKIAVVIDRDGEFEEYFDINNKTMYLQEFMDAVSQAITGVPIQHEIASMEEGEPHDTEIIRKGLEPFKGKRGFDFDANDDIREVAALFHDTFLESYIDELKEANHSPLDLHRKNRPLQGAFLEDFVTRATALLSESTLAITEVQFERICDLLGDEKRCVYVIGGRISDAIALYLSRHLRQMRGNVFHLPADPEIWPEYLLRMKPRDVLFVIDFRRYQPSLETLAERAATRQDAQIVVLTDKWLSPVSKIADEVIATPIESGTVWDSYAGPLVLMEALVTRIAEGSWDKTSKRIERWDSLRLTSGEMSDD